jgi:exosortase E/protease (VPEID-CTERM system)
MLELRWIALAALAAVELAWGIDALTVPGSTQHVGGFVAILVGSADVFLKFAIAFSAAFALILSRRFALSVSILRDQATYRWWPWVVCHALALAAFLWVSHPVFGPSGDMAKASAPWLFAWLATGGLTFAFLLLAAAPGSAWLRTAGREWPGAVVGAIAGLAAVFAVQLTQASWGPMAQLTLWCTQQLLSLIYPHIYRDPDRAILGTDHFAVGIAPECSGVEGMALMAVFVSVYLWLFRKQLTFPHALLLFPIGIVAIWLANVVRITALIVIGSSISPDIAVEGFHSQAGWISFSVVALGLIALAHRLYLSSAPGPERVVRGGAAALARALVAPLLTLLATSMLISAFSDGFAALYPLGVLTTAFVLWKLRAHYAMRSWRFSWQAVAIGVVVFVLWIALEPPDDGGGARLAARLAAMPLWLSSIWLIFRVAGSVLTVPLAEELAFRGYLIRKLVRNDFENVKPGYFTWFSLVVSSLLFGLLHANWLGGIVAGGAFALALYHRGRISDAIVAHMTSNALIAAAVLGFGRWALWT